MPKILIAQSVKNKKDRKVATSSLNLKTLIEKRLEKDAEDVSYTVVTINTKMKLANVVAIFNTSLKGLMKLEGVISCETYTIDPSKERGKWAIETYKEGDAAPVAKKSDKDVDAKALASVGGVEVKAKKKKKKAKE